MAHRDTTLLASIALAFTLSACAARPDPEPIPAASAIVAIPSEPSATPEFHGARIGRDTLRSRLQSEN